MAIWNRGIDFKNASNTTTIGGMGLYGTDNNPEKLYLGFGSEPWKNPELQITSSGINFKGKKIYHEGDKPSAADIGAAPSSHNHTALVGIQDTRSTNYTPYTSSTDFKVTFQANGTNGVSDGGTYYSLMHIPRWGDSSGGYGAELAFTDNENIWYRKGGSSSAWNGWKNLWHSGNFNPNDKANASHTHNYLPLSGGYVSGNLIVGDSKIPAISTRSSNGEMYTSKLSVTGEYTAWANQNAFSGVIIDQDGVRTPKLSSSGDISTNGWLIAGIVHATSNGQGTNFRVGDDVWIGDINVANTMSVKGYSNNAAGYIKFGNGAKIGHNGNGGSPLDIVGNTWVDGDLTSSNNLRAANNLYFTQSESGYWMRARWVYNRCAIEAPNFLGYGILSEGDIYIRSNSPFGGIVYNTSGYFYPENNNGISIGHPNGLRISTLYYTNLSAASDAKLKENISYINNSDARTIDNNFSLTMKDFYDFVKTDLKLATFDYITKGVMEESSSRGKIGFIAQDIANSKVGEKLLKVDEIKNVNDADPKTMILREGETVLSYDLTDYVNILAGALQESIKKIESLENKLNQVLNK